MSNDQTPAADRGSELSDQLGQAPERAAFARWCRENGHGELDDMLTPLDRSLRALMWPVWQGAMAAERERWMAAVSWALGTNGDFRAQGTMEGRYWWRGELAERAGLRWDGAQWVDAGPNVEVKAGEARP